MFQTARADAAGGEVDHAQESAVVLGVGQLHRILGPDAQTELVARLASEARDAHLRVKESTAAPYAGIPELLRKLSHFGVSMGVLSNKPHGAVTGSLERFFPKTRFAAVRGALPDGPVKPGGETALAMLGEMGAKPGETAMVGDGEPDILVALAAGMIPVGCTWGFTPAQRLTELGAVYLADDPEELGRIIRFGKR
ncbi:MAG: HAD family hydrolase [Candidatus Fermentibacteraceae bacterium]